LIVVKANNNNGGKMSQKQELIKGLNEDLAAELGTIIRYTYDEAGHARKLMRILKGM